MKKLTLIGITLSLLLGSLPAINTYAQGNILISKVEIPFDFSVRDKTLPAGTYRITRVFQDNNLLLLSSEDRREGVNIFTFPVQAKALPETGGLSFRRYGEAYFLFGIWETGTIQGRQISKSRTERSVERALAKRGAEPSNVDLVVISQ